MHTFFLDAPTVPAPTPLAPATPVLPRGLLPAAETLDLSPVDPNNQSLSLPPVSPGDVDGALRFRASCLLATVLVAPGAAASFVAPLPRGNRSRFVIGDLLCLSAAAVLVLGTRRNKKWQWSAYGLCACDFLTGNRATYL